MKGPVFDRYGVEEKLASGGMGEVYLARDESTGQLVILKVLRRELIRDRNVTLQFLDEVRISAQLHHPNVISVFDVGEWQGEIVMAMEYLPGHDAAALLKQAQARAVTTFPVPVATQILLEAAEGLHYVHAATDLRGKPLKVVHRDISPQNLMVREDGLTKILDFGVARAEARIVRTMQGVVKGKLSYMAPEQVRSGEITGQVDQFSLGVVAFELLTVSRLFRGNNEIETLNLVLEKPVPTPSSIARHVPAELDRVVLRMLERDPAHRYADCGEAARALAPFAGGHQAVVEFRRALGLPNPSARYQQQSVVTDGVPRLLTPRPSPAAPPRASPATSRQRALSPPRASSPLAPVPSALMGVAPSTDEHDVASEQKTNPGPMERLYPELPAARQGRVEPKTLPVVAINAPIKRGTPAFQSDGEGSISVTQPAGAALDRASGGAATALAGKTVLLPGEQITDAAGVGLPSDPNTLESVARRDPRRQWLLLALAGVAALAVGAGAALAIIKVLLAK